MSYTSDDLRDLIIEIDRKVERLILTVDTIKTKQDELTLDVSRIKDPENGLFARIKTLEEWKTTNSRITWTAITALIGLTVKQIWDTITLH